MASGMNNKPNKALNGENIHQIKKITWIGLFTNLFLSGLKFTVGIIGSSSAVIADAIHSLSDLSTDLMILIGIRFWSKPADESHPYGHLRIESIITVFLGLFLAITAVMISYHAIINFDTTHTDAPLKIAIWGPLATIFLKEILYQWTKIIGKRSQSSSLIANAWHHRTDALSSIPVLFAVWVAAYFPRLAYIDNIGAIIVSLFILKVSWNIVWPRLSELSDNAATDEERIEIQEVTRRIFGVKSLHALRTRKHGAIIYVDLHVLVDPDISVKVGHDIASVVKRALLETNPNIADVIVHIEPFEEELIIKNKTQGSL